MIDMLRYLPNCYLPIIYLLDMLRYLPNCPIRINHIPGKTNPADSFTKVVDVFLLKHHFVNRAVQV